MENSRFKFRAWDTINEEIVVHSELSSSEIGEVFSTQNDLIVQQYTGLKDKNGKEIYEGDIVIYSSHTLIIEWRETHSSFNTVKGRGEEFKTYYNFSKDMANNRLEVVGNIYENKELLEC